MLQDLFDHSRVFDACNDFDVPTAAFALFNINIEDAFEPLHPGHCISALLNGFFLCARHFRRLSSLTSFPRRDQSAMLAVRREKVVKPCQIYPRLGNQGGQRCDVIVLATKTDPGAGSINVTETLREQLLQGELAPHTRLQETALAERMGVSRPPIREALSVLARDGLLDYTPNRGYSVRHFSLDDILAAFRVRAVLEGQGCRLLAERGLPADTDTQLQHALGWGETLLQASPLQHGQYEQWREMNKAFRLAILQAAGNDLLIRFARLSRNIPIVFNGSFRWYSARDFQRSQDHHQVIYTAMKNGQAERADHMMQEHVMQAAEILQRHYASLSAPTG